MGRGSGGGGGIANISFIMLFPCFFIYNCAVIFGYITPFLGGYFGNVALILSGPLALTLIFSVLKKRIAFYPSDLLFAGLLLFSTIIAFINYFVGEIANNKEFLFWFLSMIYLNMVCYMVGIQINLESRNFTILLLVLFILLVSITFSFQTGDGLFYLRVLAEDYHEYISSYQGLGSALVITGFLLLSATKSSFFKSLVFALCFFALFFNSSRSEFIFFSLSVVVAFLVINKSMVRALFFVGLCFISLVLVYSNYQHIIELYPNNRILKLADIEQSMSVQNRIYFMKVAIDTILTNPIFGNFGSYVLIHGMGGYAHNLLSAWVDIGLIGFLGYVFLVILILKVSVAKARVFPSGEVELSLYVALFVFFAVVFSKMYLYYFIGLAVGFLNRAQSLKNADYSGLLSRH